MSILAATMLAFQNVEAFSDTDARRMLLDRLAGNYVIVADVCTSNDT